MTNAGVIFGHAIEKVGSIFSDMDFSVLQLLMAGFFGIVMVIVI